MSPLFPVWSDTALRVALGAAALGIPAVFVIPMVYVRTPSNLDRQFPLEQPVQFDHRHHVQDDGIECLYCHGGAERTATAGVPPTELCMGCHSQIWNQSPMLEPVRRSFFSGQPIPWNRVHAVPDFVYFNHAVHVTGARLPCQECHGDVAGMSLPYKTRLFTMGWCLDCHQRQPQTTPAAPLALNDPRAVNDPTGSPAQASEGLEPAVHPLTNCTTCHR